MNRNIESWHSFYSNKQRQRDLNRTRLTFHRKFKQLLWNEFENSKLIEISEIKESMNNYIYIKNGSNDLMVGILLVPEIDAVKVKLIEKEEKIEFSDISELNLLDGIVFATKMFNEINAEDI